MILISSGLGLMIEFWKITKAMDVSVDPSKFPFIVFKDKAGLARLCLCASLHIM
jgi:hypothetical protein